MDGAPSPAVMSAHAAHDDWRQRSQYADRSISAQPGMSRMLRLLILPPFVSSEVEIRFRRGDASLPTVLRKRTGVGAAVLSPSALSSCRRQPAEGPAFSSSAAHSKKDGASTGSARTGVGLGRVVVITGTPPARTAIRRRGRGAARRADRAVRAIRRPIRAAPRQALRAWDNVRGRSAAWRRPDSRT
ncbi:hypothetical protein EV664_10964 [Stakelama pacifica]|uniref:Uncharacterized protein n=1 Tax=Stakelama pacifica TaxID=517720 RepID=A0A4R6FJF9_9SPHN|nr:hypothetical protein EV664_10964 [Stakelama pacifica]